ncbi:269_t:CDS:2 [Cetraspora pellucida]|uniref:269_t:CDS:1 n=1 Tax=Cetraspora pellucida TaxID=1433469 RepID=A0A9N9AT90_9GLOM|nr:269_t:CDS:2 [Cetraspora pellucida]
MLKIQSYYMTNIKSELIHYEKKLTESELYKVINNLTIIKVMAIENKKVIFNSDELFFEDTEFNQNTLNINEI